MEKSKSSNFFEGAMILVLANALVKVIGALFSVPITNLIGGDGNGIFTVAYYIYSAMFVISTAGLPVAVSKMVAEANALGHHREVKRIFRVALCTFSIVSAVITAAMMLGARWLVAVIGNNLAYYAVLAVAPSIFVVSIVSAVRGYYQGLSNMVPTAISQVIEALGKLIFGLLFTYILLNKGYPLEIVVAGSIGGVTAGTVLAAVYIIAVKLRERPASAGGGSENVPSVSVVLKRLINISVPITIGASALSLTNLIDTGVVLNRLQHAGLTEPAANYIYGVYGLAVKVFNMPQALIVGVGVSVIPAIAAAYARHEAGKAQRTAESALRITVILALPCAVGLAALAHPILSLLYYRIPTEVSIASPLLVIIAPAVLLLALQTVTNAMLQAMGREKVPMFTMFIGGAIKLTTNYILVGTPGIEIYGAPIGTTLCYGTIAVINLLIIKRLSSNISLLRVFAKPFVASVLMGGFAFFSFGPIASILGEKIGLLICIGLSALVYLVLLIAIKALPKDDILMLPKGQKIAKMLKL